MFSHNYSTSEQITNFLESDINDSNSNFSGGELQKIILIRALLRTDAPLMILDEPTKSLDTQSSEVLKNILFDLKKTKIIILVSHGDFFDDISDYNFDLESTFAPKS